MSAAAGGEHTDRESLFEAEEWPHGLRCACCLQEFSEGQPIAERLDAFQDDIPIVIVTCVACDLAGAPIRG